MASSDWVMDAEMDLGAKFFEETGITVDYQIVPADQYINLLMTKLNAGECTDIFGSQGGRFDIVTQLNVEKNALPLSGEAWASNVDPLAAAELSVNGVLYGQPIQDVSAVWAVAYNKQIFSDLSLSVPTTYAELKTICQTILDSGITPIYECVSDGWHHVLWFPEMGVALEKAEPGLADKLNRNETTFAQSTAALTLVSQIKEMADLGYWGDNYMANTYADATKNIASGEFAMFVANQGFPSEIHVAYPDFPAENIGYFVIPLLDNQILNMNPVGPSRFVYSGSANADAAKQYLAFIAQPENLQYLVDNVPKYNALPYSGLQNRYSDEIKAFYDAYPVHGTVYQTLVKYLNPQWMEIGKELTAMLQGDETAEQVLANIDRNRADQAKAAGDAYWQ
ncbi:MAG: carbohydrate ABC transporter substrate-binding protein [Clostridiales bacterium]|nr:carbohydrate ABC transporter substrate-binding protein [Clostridiales bacterium]